MAPDCLVPELPSGALQRSSSLTANGKPLRAIATATWTPLKWLHTQVPRKTRRTIVIVGWYYDLPKMTMKITFSQAHHAFFGGSCTIPSHPLIFAGARVAHTQVAGSLTSRVSCARLPGHMIPIAVIAMKMKSTGIKSKTSDPSVLLGAIPRAHLAFEVAPNLA